MAAGLLSVAPAASAIIISFNYDFDTAGFLDTGTTDGLAARAALDSAAGFFESRLSDSLSAITPSPGNTWTASFTDPSTGANGTLVDLPILANEIVVIAGARDLGIGSGGPILGRGNVGSATASGDLEFEAAALTRGQGSILELFGPTATDFGRWGGHLTMDVDTNWHFDVNTLPGTAEDFLSTAFHELGHVLGFGTSASFDFKVNASNEFTGAASVALNGGSVPLQSPTPGAHWANEVIPGGPLDPIMSPVAGGPESYITNPGVLQEVAMDPQILGGRKLFTDLDLAGLQDLGWEVTFIPLPAAFWMLLSGTVLLLLRNRTTRGVSEATT